MSILTTHPSFLVSGQVRNSKARPHRLAGKFVNELILFYLFFSFSFSSDYNTRLSEIVQRNESTLRLRVLMSLFLFEFLPQTKYSDSKNIKNVITRYTLLKTMIKVCFPRDFTLSHFLCCKSALLSIAASSQFEYKITL
jgi:hypothetical protein